MHDRGTEDTRARRRTIGDLVRSGGRSGPRTALAAFAIALALAAAATTPYEREAQASQDGDPEARPYWERSIRGDEEEILVRPKLAEFVFGSRGGALRSVYLYFAPAGILPTELIPDTETRPAAERGRRERVYVQGAVFPLQILDGGVPDGDRTYSVSAERRDDEVFLEFVADWPSGLQVVKRYRVAETAVYTLRVEVEIRNPTDAELLLAPNTTLVVGRGVGRSPDPDAQVRFLYGTEVRTEPLEAPDFRGIGFVGDGLAFFLRDAGDRPLEDLRPRRLVGSEGQVLWGLALPSRPLPPRQSLRWAFTLYAGRAKYTLLDEQGLGGLAPPGLFSQLVIAVVELLDWLYRATGNYGYAIILFTLITRILLFPLTRQQFHAMAKMAELRPKLEKLQQRYPTFRRLRELHPNLGDEELMKRDRENRRALQEKMMELYREEGVNPLGGCLPLLIQFPILIILWRAILYSAEAIHLSPGFLWMDDLSLRDPYYLIVALTALAMILQTKTTPTMNTSSQGPNPMIMMLFSIGLMVLFLKDFPSGLWLYYFLTTVIQVGQQVFINWELEQLQRKRSSDTETGRDREGRPSASAATAPPANDTDTDTDTDADTGSEDLADAGRKGRERDGKEPRQPSRARRSEEEPPTP